MIRYKQNIVIYDATEEVICPCENSFLQFVGNNTDHDLANFDGENTHHGLASIAITNGKFSNSKFIGQAILREKKYNCSDIASNKGIEIKQFNSPAVPSLARIQLVKVSSMTVPLLFCGIVHVYLTNNVLIGVVI